MDLVVLGRNAQDGRVSVTQKFKLLRIGQRQTNGQVGSGVIEDRHFNLQLLASLCGVWQVQFQEEKLERFDLRQRAHTKTAAF